LGFGFGFWFFGLYCFSLIGCRIPFFANNASSGYDVAPQTQNLFLRHTPKLVFMSGEDGAIACKRLRQAELAKARDRHGSLRLEKSMARQGPRKARLSLRSFAALLYRIGTSLFIERKEPIFALRLRSIYYSIGQSNEQQQKFADARSLCLDRYWLALGLLLGSRKPLFCGI
jgi:hypothetical protein